MSTALAALCVLLPVWAWSPRVLDDPRLDGGLLAGAVLALLVARPRARPLPGTPLFLAALGLGLLGLLLVAPRPELHGSVSRYPPPWGGLADRAPFASAWVLACLAAAAPFAVRRALPWIFGGVALAAGYGLLQIVGFDPLGLRPAADSPPTAPLAGTNHAAELLVVATIAGACWAGPLRRGSTKLWWLAAFVPMAFHVGYLGVTAARLSLPLAAGWAASRRRALLPGLLLVAAAFLAGEGARMVTAGTPAEQTQGAADASSSAAIRWLTYGACLQRAAGAPLGLGLGRFEVDYPFFRDPEELRLASADFEDPATPVPKDPHSEPLLALLETGWLGAALLAAALWRLLRRSGRAAWTAPALLALGIHALVRSPLSDNPATLALAALLAGLGREDLGEGAATAPTSGEGALTLWALAVAALLAAPFQVMGELQVARRMPWGADAPPNPEPLASAVAWRPWDAVAWSLLAADRSAAGDDAAAVRDALQRALESDPGNLFALTGLFRMEMVAADRQESLGLAALQRAEELAPHHPAVREGRTLWLESQAERQREAAAQMLLEQQPGAHARYEVSHLLRALAAGRRGKWEEAREALEAAAFYEPNKRARLERMARSESLDEALLRAVVAELLPEWAAVLGPPPDEL